MYSMNQVYVCLFVLLFQSVSSLSAQVVSTSADGPVIDLSALNPLGCVLSSSEAVTRRTAMYASGAPSNNALLSVGLNVSGHNGTWNAEMSTKYQVMRANHTVGATDFVSAWNACKTYNGEGGSAGTWRLPTQRELDMIWILHPQLIGKVGFTAFGATDYRSSTEYDASQAWYIAFSNGYPNYSSKTAARNVRCIRDL